MSNGANIAHCSPEGHVHIFCKRRCSLGSNKTLKFNSIQFNSIVSFLFLYIRSLNHTRMYIKNNLKFHFSDEMTLVAAIFVKPSNLLAKVSFANWPFSFNFTKNNSKFLCQNLSYNPVLITPLLWNFDYKLTFWWSVLCNSWWKVLCVG